MASLTQVAGQLKTNNEENMAGHERVSSSVEKLTGSVNKLLGIMKQSQLDMIEAMREKGGASGSAGGSAAADKPDTSKWKTILAGIVAVGAGILAGLADSIKKLAQIFRVDKLLKGINTKFLAFVDDALKGADNLIKPLKTFFSAEGGAARFVKGLRDTFMMTFTGASKIIDDLIQPFKSMFAADGVAGSRISKFFNSIVDIFKFPFEPIIDDLAKGVKAIFGGGEGPSLFKRIGTFIKGVFDPIMDAAKSAFSGIKSAFSILDAGGPLMTTLGNIGRVIGRLFLPFTLIMTAFDVVKGAIAGFEEDGFLGGLAGAFEGLFNSLIGAPLDLLKSAVAWVLDKMGFDDSAAALKGFSFSDIITNIIMSPLEMLKRAFNGVIELIASAIEKFDIPFVDEKAAADSIRKMKLGEGMTKTEERNQPAKPKGLVAQKIAEEKIKMEKADDLPQLSFPKESESLFAKRRRLRKEARAQRLADRMEKLEPENSDELKPSGSGKAGVAINAPQTNINNNSSSSQAMVMPHVATQDKGDPNRLQSRFAFS